MGKILHFKALFNHEIAMIKENSEYIVQDFSLVTSVTKTEKFSTFGEAFTRWNEVCTEILEEV